MEQDYDYCPDTISHKHAWYQTTLAKVFEENDKRGGKEVDGVFYSHACKCGQWRTGTYPPIKN